MLRLLMASAMMTRAPDRLLLKLWKTRYASSCYRTASVCKQVLDSAKSSLPDAPQALHRP